MKTIIKIGGRILLTALAWFQLHSVNAQVSGTLAIPGYYPTITAALNDIENVGLAGPTILELQSGYSGAAETYPINIEDLPGISSVNTLTIRPAIGATGLNLTGGANGTLNLVEASHVTIDGRPGGVGTQRELSIVNTSPFLSAIKFTDGSHYNRILHCILAGNNAFPNGGVIIFGTSFNTETGNVQNTIEYCKIMNEPGGVPVNGIYSSGSPDLLNFENTIINNEILNFSGSGVYIDPIGNGGNWTISWNSFYNNLATPPSGSQTVIHFAPGPGSNLNAIEGNSIGGQDVFAGGDPWVNTGENSFTGIYLAAGNGASTELHNNVIQNIALISPAGVQFTGISIASGIILNNGNTIGSATEANSIVVSGASSTIIGILVNSSDAVSVTGDNIGNISTTGGGVDFYGIRYEGGASVEISNNLIHDFSADNADDIDYTGVFLAGGGIIPSSLHYNTIRSVSLTSQSAIQFTGISLASGITGNSGNTIGSATDANSIVVSGASSYIRGISVSSSEYVSITGDNIGHITVQGGEASFTGIQYTGESNVDITDNQIHDYSANSLENLNFTGILLVGGGITPSELHDNVVRTISLISGAAADFTGVSFASGITANNGNIIGSATEANSISVSGASSTVIGILVHSSDAVSLTGDFIGNMTSNGTSEAIVNGILIQANGSVEISENGIENLTGTSSKGICVNVTGSATVTIEDNTLTGNGTGTGIEAAANGNALLDLTVINNTVSNWEKGFLLLKDPGSTLLQSIHDNVIEGNNFGFDNQTDILQDATCNWWGDASGPSGAGPGTGDPVSENVIFSPWSTIPTYVDVDAGPDQTIYIGYGPQSIVLTASAIACGDAGYLWSDGSTESSITVGPNIQTTYTVTVTDGAGRTATDQVTVFVEDIRCGSNKVYVCHNGQTICIQSVAVLSHLSHGDALGSCEENMIVMDETGDHSVEDFPRLESYPNPFETNTTIQYALSERSHVSMKIFNPMGIEVIELLNREVEAGEYYLEYNPVELPSGVYLCVLFTTSAEGIESISKRIVAF